ncbi:uncharacterized protein LOC112082793 [Eutrema salsugineum]|uniref:uncharacterized protein LOC112082793 n=1 Tax=Eutrema salsugineum TaxID=72664 RepID=UPI000CED15E6|nr:uncharacterized protein LOC112082793 [Eutrema salsugineum]
MGLKKLQDSNQVYGLKLIWLLFSSNGSFWVAWVKKRIFQGQAFLVFRFPARRQLDLAAGNETARYARPFLSCQVRNGLSALFWHDDWTSLGPLIDITGANGPRVTGISSLASVSSAVSNGSWSLSQGRHPILVLLRGCLPLVTPDPNSSEPDFYLWRNSLTEPPGRFSTQKTWLYLHPPAPPVDWFSVVWFKARIPKHAFLLWVILRKRLPSRDRLRGWGLNVPSECLLCDASPESSSHIFFECIYSTQVWQAFFSHHSLSSPSSLEAIVNWVKSPSSHANLNGICKIIFQAVAYFIWKERNARLHSGIFKQAPALIKEIQLQIRAKLASLDRVTLLNLAQSGSAVSNGYESFISSWYRFIQI